MKINNIPGDITDTSAKTKALGWRFSILWGRCLLRTLMREQLLLTADFTTAKSVSEAVDV